MVNLHDILQMGYRAAPDGGCCDCCDEDCEDTCCSDGCSCGSSGSQA